jgi:hypothetical protein
MGRDQLKIRCATHSDLRTYNIYTVERIILVQSIGTWDQNSFTDIGMPFYLIYRVMLAWSGDDGKAEYHLLLIS